MSNPSKSDIDGIKQRAGSRKRALSEIRAIIAMRRQGRASSSCMDEIECIMSVCDRGLNRQHEAVK